MRYPIVLIYPSLARHLQTKTCCTREKQALPYIWKIASFMDMEYQSALRFGEVLQRRTIDRIHCSGKNYDKKRFATDGQLIRESISHLEEFSSNALQANRVKNNSSLQSLETRWPQYHGITSCACCLRQWLQSPLSYQIKVSENKWSG